MYISINNILQMLTFNISIITYVILQVGFTHHFVVEIYSCTGYCCCSVAKLSDSLQSHELQHARLPCPSLSPWACSNSCPLRQMPSNHLILRHSLFLYPSIFSSIRVFSNESALRIRWPKYCISPSNEYSGVIAGAPIFQRNMFFLLTFQCTPGCHWHLPPPLLCHTSFFSDNTQSILKGPSFFKKQCFIGVFLVIMKT